MEWDVESSIHGTSFYGLVIERFAGKKVFKRVITYKIPLRFLSVNLNRDMGGYIYLFLNLDR